ncbi:MAG: hypothetical protein KatS3mg011_2288 [Acidimicrobiia bacterium]|nr:MAG: hypothetical protein KatS3mg011_2288 [Acidimicrobiia bacterium]
MFGLTEEQLALREMAASLARERYRPRVAEWDEHFTFFPKEEKLYLASLGLMGICLPEEYGGGGAGLIDALIVIEELAKECQLAAFYVFEANTGPARVVELFGTPEQKAKFLPPIIRGEKVMAVAISEPDAGSAATDMTTRARVDGDSLVLSGMKRWCSGGGAAEQYLVYCRLNDEPGARAIGAVVVEADTPGVSFGKQERFMGFHGIPSADIFFDEARVPVENLIVGAGGFGRLFSAFSIERLGNATMSLAIGQACLDRTARYVPGAQAVREGDRRVPGGTAGAGGHDPPGGGRPAAHLPGGMAGGKGCAGRLGSLYRQVLRQRDGEKGFGSRYSAAWR